MSLKYYNTYNATRNNTPNETYRDDFTAMQDLSFENAPNVYYGGTPEGIEYEPIYGSNIFSPIPVARVDEVVSYNTGLYSADDFKVFVFKNEFMEANKFTYGSKFKWKNNTWLVINSNIYNGVVNSVEVRRCNNVARFYDKWGNKIYEPCILDTTLRFTRNNMSMPIITSNGEQKLWLQRNERTVYIKPNQRFLFGPKESRVAYKMYASGSKDYLNTITDDDNSPSLTEIYMQFDQIDEQRDDLVNGFADARVAFYSIDGKDISGDYKVGDIIPLEFLVYRDRDIIDIPLEYYIDNPGIATISENTIIVNNDGNFTLTVFISENRDISRNFNIKVVKDPITNYQIKLTPNNNYVLQGQKQIFECNMYRNGAIDNQVTEFEFKDNTINVPKEKYAIKIIDDQHFEIQNKSMFMSSPIVVLCKAKECEQTFEFELRGVY